MATTLAARAVVRVAAAAPPTVAAQPERPFRALPPCAATKPAALRGQSASFLSGQKVAVAAGAVGVCRGGRPRATHCAADANSESSRLADLPINSFVNAQGFIRPAVPPDTAATVFAVLDKAQRVQYIGFATDVRNSMRKLIVRRPYSCFFVKLYNFTQLDQARMLALRSQWYDELGAPPPGNGDPSQRALWEGPVDAGAVSERGKAAAAASRVRQLVESLADRGVKEVMEFDPDLLAKGLCDVKASQALSEEELAALSLADQQASAQQRHVVLPTPGGRTMEFDIFFESNFATNGGMMHDVVVSMDDKDSTHRIITSRALTEALGVTSEELVERAMAFLLSKRVARQTEGVLTGGTFPINYFSVSEIEQWFSDFVEMFDGTRTNAEIPAPWGFSRIESPLHRPESLPLIGPMA